MPEIQTTNGDTETKSRKQRRVDANGDPMRRMVLVLSKADYKTVMSSLQILTSPLFAEFYGWDVISSDGPDEEVHGRAIASICDLFLSRKTAPIPR